MEYVAPPPRTPARRSPAPRISIVIRAYQAADVIGASIESALAQTVPAHEIIVCDDGSTDGIDAALAPFRDRIVVYRTDHGGAAAALNAGVRAATGDFIAILDADDVYHPARLEALSGLLAARPDIDIATTDATMEVNGSATGNFYDGVAFDIADQRSAILRVAFVGGWPAARRTTILDVGGSDETLAIAHDWDLWLRMIFHGSIAGLVPLPLMTYRIRSGALTSNRVRALEERVEMLEKAGRTLALSGSERDVLAASLRSHRARANAAAAQADLQEHAVRARIRLASVALRPGLERTVRREIARSLVRRPQPR